MQRASSAFVDALRFGSAIVMGQVTVMANGAATQYTVPLSDVQITIDRTSENRRQGQVTMVLDPTVPPSPLMPTGPSSLLAPFGNEVKVEFSLVGDEGTPMQWIPCGVFAIATTTVEDSTTDVTITLDLYDRSWVIAQRTLLAPYNVPAVGGAFEAEIAHLLDQVWSQSSNMPALVYNITPTDYVVPAGTYNQGEDPWQAALDMAQSAGYELFFDVNGVVTGFPIPDPTAQPVSWTFNPASVTAVGQLNAPSTYDYQVSQNPFSTPAAVTVTMTRDQVYNDFWVSATGPNNAPSTTDTTAAPVQAEAKDSNPASPTYVGGGMGDVPQFTSDSLITSLAQAQAEADYDLAQALAQSWTVQVECPPNPLFDIDDVFSIVNPRVGLTGQKVVVDQVQFDISYAATTQLQGRVIG
ncbi:MAG TPA: hypothetical protein VF288_10505 [Mycobacteriales bacterium]